MPLSLCFCFSVCVFFLNILFFLPFFLLSSMLLALKQNNCPGVRLIIHLARVCKVYFFLNLSKQTCFIHSFTHSFVTNLSMVLCKDQCYLQGCGNNSPWVPEKVQKLVAQKVISVECVNVLIWFTS